MWPRGEKAKCACISKQQAKDDFQCEEGANVGQHHGVMFDQVALIKWVPYSLL